MARGENMDWSGFDQSTPRDSGDEYRRLVANSMFGFFLVFGVGAVLLLVVVLWLIGMVFGVEPGL